MRTRPLAEIAGRELRPLLEEEAEHWAEELLWDYSDVSAAVASGLERRALTGFVLQDGPRSVAYCYYMLDAGRAIVGSLFAAAGFRGQGLEESLLDAVLEGALSHPHNDRVECQTLFSTAAAADGRFARAGFQSRVRHYLVRPLDMPVETPEHRWKLRPLRREDLAPAAQVIHASHRGSLDAALNLTYATPGYCRGFVETLVLRAGCGRFDPEASFLAEGPGGPAGVILSSHLSRTNGHVCQVSVAPEAQARGLGEVLMTSALAAFRKEGLGTASLSVTHENRRAYRLYQRLGFRLRKEFAAHAWVRPPRGSSCPPEHAVFPGARDMILSMLLVLLDAPATPPARPSPVPAASAPFAAPVGARHTLLVLPLEAAEGTSEPWISEAVADQLPRTLALLGVPAVSRAERRQAQSGLEIPDVPLSRATSVRVAEALGATRLVTGTYAVEGQRLTLSLRLLDVERATLSAPLISSGSLEGLMDVIDRLAWDVALAGPTPPARSRDEWLAARPKVPFDAYKAYARGLAARDPKAKVTLLRSALAAAPAFDAVRLALGRLLLDQREFSAANQMLARVPATSLLAREARFVQGVALYELGRYREASRVYSALAQQEPTPGALNNYALAVLRDPVPSPMKASDVLRQALALDPDSVDLAFNLAWALLAEDDAAGAAFHLKSLTQVVPLDKHTRVVLTWALRRAGRETDADREWQGVAALAPGYESLLAPDLSRRFERIMRSERPFELARETRSDTQVAASLYLKAQRMFDGGDAVGALTEATRAGYLDPYNRSIHLLLARLHRARGDGEKALNEFRMALWSEDDAAVRVEVAGLLREMGRAAEARAEAARALALAPGNEAARKLAATPQ